MIGEKIFKNYKCILKGEYFLVVKHPKSLLVPKYDCDSL